MSTTESLRLKLETLQLSHDQLEAANRRLRADANQFLQQENEHLTKEKEQFHDELNKVKRLYEQVLRVQQNSQSSTEESPELEKRLRVETEMRLDQKQQVEELTVSLEQMQTKCETLTINIGKLESERDDLICRLTKNERTRDELLPRIRHLKETIETSQVERVLDLHRALQKERTNGKEERKCTSVDFTEKFQQQNYLDQSKRTTCHSEQMPTSLFLHWGQVQSLHVLWKLEVLPLLRTLVNHVNSLISLRFQTS